LRQLLNEQARTLDEQTVITRSAVATYVLYKNILDGVCVAA
jgi:hypothetical protein